VASFPYFNGTGSVYVCIGESTHSGPYSVLLKYGKLGTKYPWICGYFLQCMGTDKRYENVIVFDWKLRYDFLLVFCTIAEMGFHRGSSRTR